MKVVDMLLKYDNIHNADMNRLYEMAVSNFNGVNKIFKRRLL